MADQWGADVPISMPDPSPYPSLVPMGGFTMTEYGMAADISIAEWEEEKNPTFVPLWHVAFSPEYPNGR